MLLRSTIGLFILFTTCAHGQLNLFIDTTQQEISFGSTASSVDPTENIGTFNLGATTAIPAPFSSTFWIIGSGVLTTENLEVSISSSSGSILGISFEGLSDFSTVTGNSATMSYAGEDAAIVSLLDSVGSGTFAFTTGAWNDGDPTFSTIPEASALSILIGFFCVGLLSFRRRHL